MSENANLTDDTSALTVPNYSATSTEPQTADSEQKKNWFFPMEPFWLLSVAVPYQYAFIPSYMRVIHTFSHLVLLTGVIANTILLLDLILEWRSWGRRVDKEPWLASVLLASSAFAFLCFLQMCSELMQYSGNIQSKSAEIQKGKDAYEKQFHDLLSQLDTLIGQASDTQAALAERSLDSKRRDFLRFLRSIGPKLGTANGSGPLLQNFRSFICMWLKMFEECSVDPVARPFLIATEEELQQCSSAAEVAELVGHRVKAVEVKFIRDQVEEGKKNNSIARSSWKKLKKMQSKAVKFTGLARFVKRKKLDLEAGQLPTGQVYEKQQCDQEQHDPRWLKFERVGFGMEFTEEEVFPACINCGVISCTVLSPEHFRLLISFFIGLGLLLFNEYGMNSPLKVVVASLSVCLVCVMFVLYDFLDIDTIQRLEAQIKEIQAATERVEERRKRMLDFFDRVHLLADFWLHRTLPRLELTKHLAEELEDVTDANLVPTLAEIAVHVGSVENALLPVERWLKPLSRESKTQLSVTLNEISARGNLRGMLDAMPDAVQALSERKKRLLMSEG